MGILNRHLIESRAFLRAYLTNRSDTHQCIFFHIPKTAGSSIGQMGLINYRGHFPRARWAKLWMSKRKWDSFFKFTFVRNPWDRFVSLFSYYTQMDATHKWYVGANREIANAVKGVKTLTDFCEHLENSSWKNHFLFDEQWTWIANSKKQLIVDFVGRFENIDKDFEKICRTVRFPLVKLEHVNKSNHRRYEDYYDDIAFNFVSIRYANDIALFNYTF